MRVRQEERDAACATACDSLSAAAAEMSSKLEQLSLRVEEATGGVTDSVAQIAASLEQQRAHAEAECASTLECIREGHASEASEAGKTLLATITAELDAAALLMGKGRAQDFYSQRALGEVAMGEVSMRKHGMMERDAAERALLEKWLDSAKSAEASIDEARALSQSVGDLQNELAGVQAQAAAAESRTSGLLSRLEEEVTALRFQTEALASTELEARGEARHAPSEPELDIEARLEEALTARARAEADLAAERAARYALEARIHASAFEHRALQAHAAVASDPIDTSFSSALHSASLPLRVEVERLSRGSYKLRVASERPRKVSVVLSPNGIAKVRVGGGVVSVAEYLHELCAAASSGQPASDSRARRQLCTPPPVPVAVISLDVMSDA